MIVSKNTLSYLSEQEGDGSKGERPAVLVAEVSFIRFGSVQHFIVNVRDVQNQPDDQRQTCRSPQMTGVRPKHNRYYVSTNFWYLTG